MAVLLRATKSFSGDEGKILRGDIFEVETQERADRLKEARLAEDAPDGAEVTNLSQKNAQLEDMKVDELKTLAENEGVDLTGLTRKDDIIRAIRKKRETDSQLEQQNQTAVYGTETADDTVQPAAQTETDGGTDGGTDSGTDGGGGA